MSINERVAESSANKEVSKVYDDIKKTRNTDYINNFWKHLANDPILLQETWGQFKSAMSSGEIPALMKELIYIAVSISNNCNYCIHSHTAAAKNMGMTSGMYNELMNVILMANKTNSIANALGVAVDERYSCEEKGQ